MASRDHFAECGFILEAYQSAKNDFDEALRHDGWFQQGESRRHLTNAASTLCKNMHQLLEYSPFQQGLDEFRREFVRSPREAKALFGDIEKFLQLEVDVLKNTKLSERDAKRLFSDVINAMNMVEGYPNIEHIDNLIARLRDHERLICKAEEELMGQGFSLLSLRYVGTGIIVFAGVGMITANAISALQSIDFDGSVWTGIATIGSVVGR